MSSLTMFSLSQDCSWNQVSLHTVITLLFPRSPKLLLSGPNLSPLPPPFLSAIPFLPSHHHYHDRPDYSSSHTFTRGFFLAVFGVAEFCVLCSEDVQVVTDCSFSFYKNT
jgi:hypothetical protein